MAEPQVVATREPISRWHASCEHCDWSDWEESRAEAVAYGHAHVEVSHGCAEEWGFRVRGYADSVPVQITDLRRLIEAYSAAVPWPWDDDMELLVERILGAIGRPEIDTSESHSGRDGSSVEPE